jgi:fatty acid desaturase
MSSTVASPSPGEFPITRIPDPGEPVPRVAWPSGLLAGGLGLWSTASALALTGVVPWWVAMLVNAVAAFLLFTVTHEAWHHTTSTSSTLNTWVGRVATAFFAPFAGFGMARYIHMQHHRFTNDEDADPDHFLVHGRRWTTLLRWQSIDIFYFRFYARHWGSRPRAERTELVVTFLLTAAVATAAVATGHGWEFLYLYILPSRIQLLSLGYAFAYLPHHDLPDTPQTDRFKTTRVRVGAEKILTPVMLYQNYHLVHHLHPVVPFYRYIAVWRRNEEEYLARDPAVVSPRGRPVTADELRELRALRDHEH